VLIASRELPGLFVLIDHFHVRVIHPTARPAIVTAILVVALIVSLTHVSRPQVSLFDSTLALQAMQALRDLPMVVGGAW